MFIIYLLLFAAGWAVAVYVFNCLLSRKMIAIQPRIALLYVTTVGMLGVYAEFIIGNLYHGAFGMPLWKYSVYPIHDGYTSLYAPVIWGMYGFYLYLCHDKLTRRHNHSDARVAAIISVESIAVEALVNFTFLTVFGYLLFYYFPGDLWHLTSVQTLPFYLLAGFVITRAIRLFSSRPVLFSGVNVLAAALLLTQ